MLELVISKMLILNCYVIESVYKNIDLEVTIVVGVYT